MNLKQLEAFVHVAEGGSFSKAAKELFLTQPTVSAHISSLEKELNVRLFIRNTKEVNLSDDGRELYKYAKDPRVGPRAGWPVHTSVENSREIIETVFSTEGTFAVVLKETELPVGCIGIMRNANLSTLDDEVELGYWLGQPYWGQGLIPEACEELIKYCFETLNCSKIWCAYYRGNRNSCRVMQKCGMVKMALEEDIEYKGVFHHCLYYGIEKA